MKQLLTDKIIDLSFAKPFILALSAVLILLHSFVPQGFMPEQSEDGKLTLVICSGDGMREITISSNGQAEDSDRQDTDTDHDSQGADSCPLIVLQNPLMETEHVSFALPFNHGIRLSFSYKALTNLQAVSFANASRAPPVFSIV